MSTKMCNVRIPEAIVKRYDELAARTGRTRTFYLRQAIEDHIEDIEDAFASAAVMERVRRSEEELVSLAVWEKGLENR